MGVKNNEYVIFTSSNKNLLKKLQKFLIKQFSNHSSYHLFLDCIGNIGGGMNGLYSLPLLPTGYNGGYEESFLENIYTKINKINFNEQKTKKKYIEEIKWFSLAHTDWGTVYDNNDYRDKTEYGSCEQLKWARSNTSIPSNIDEELEKIELQVNPAKKLLKKFNETN